MSESVRRPQAPFLDPRMGPGLEWMQPSPSEITLPTCMGGLKGLGPQVSPRHFLCLTVRSLCPSAPP